MRGKALFTAFVFCCATLGASHQAAAASGNQDLLEQMQREGWTVAAPGVLQRNLGGGKVETLGFGADGLRFKIQQMAEHLSLLRQDYANHPRSEEHTSELQSQFHLVCRLLLEKKKRQERSNAAT